MRRLVKPLALVAFVVAMGVASTSLSACHENLTTKQICDAFRAGEHWTVINWVYDFGVVKCRATTSAGGFDEYCVFPGPDPHWFNRRECNWTSSAANVEGPGELP